MEIESNAFKEFQEMHGGLPHETERLKRELYLPSLMSLPESYYSNTEKETLCNLFVGSVATQFYALYTSRKPLLLLTKNEVNQEKFICTFIKPTLLHYEDFVNLHTASKFISDFIKYESLDNYSAFPRKIMSPATTLSWQVGNCIEISLVLCSVLIGAGYDAYVVVGYASEEIALNQQDQNLCPESIPVEPPINQEDTSIRTETKYATMLRKRPLLQSKYDKSLESNSVSEMNESFTDSKIPTSCDTGAEWSSDYGREKLLHSWVLVLPTKRKVEETVFIEPSTGECFSVNSPSYYHIESLFNHKNYFINLNHEANLKSLNLLLDDSNTWEPIFYNTVNAEDSLKINKSISKRILSKQKLKSINIPNEDPILNVPLSWSQSLVMSKQQYKSRYPGNAKTIQYSNATLELMAEYSNVNLIVKRITFYKPNTSNKTIAEVHSFYKGRADNLRHQAIIPKCTVNNEIYTQIEEWFNKGNRKEKIVGLLYYTYIKGHSRKMLFDWKYREDGLMERVETYAGTSSCLPSQIYEKYRGRDTDALIYRSATFNYHEKEEIHNDLLLASFRGVFLDNYVASSVDQAITELSKPMRMIEKYDRNLSIPADQDISEIHYINPFAKARSEILVLYHYSENCITRPLRLFPNSKQMDKFEELTTENLNNYAKKPLVILPPGCERPTDNFLSRQLKYLINKEEKCFFELQQKVIEIFDLIHQLYNEQRHPIALLNNYDTLHNRNHLTKEERENLLKEKKKKELNNSDYLAPYINSLNIGKIDQEEISNIELTSEQAQRVRDLALTTLKENLIQRGQVMQNRMDREKEELQKMQSMFQRNQKSGENSKKMDEFIQFSKNTTWKIKVLDQRIKKHIEQSSEKYANLAQKLASDPRLSSIY